MDARQVFKHLGLPLVLGLVPTLAQGSGGGGAIDSDRVLIEQVRLLSPGASGFRTSGPIDLLLEGGHVVLVDPEDPVQLEPGEMRLRGQDRWLIPSPRARVVGVPRSSDLVLAGLSGLGALAVAADPPTLEAVRARAALDTAALPELIRADAQVEGSIVIAPGRGPTLARLAEAVGGARSLLVALSRRVGDPFAPGAPASFLLLTEDPRSVPKALLDPHAVLIGSEVLLKSERVTRLEEARAGEELPMPEAEDLREAAGGGGQSWSRRYRLVVDGLERGWALLRVVEAPDGSVDAHVTARVGSPAEETLRATVSWSPPVGPDGLRWQRAASVKLRSQGRSMEARTIEGPHGRALQIVLDGTPLEGGPIDLKPEELVLPHTLLILVDSALMAGGSSGGEILEVAFMDGPLEVHRSPRRPLRQVRPGDRLPLDESRLLRQGGASAALLRVLPVDEGRSGQALIVLDQARRPLLLLLETPWGYLEWSASSAGKQLYESDFEEEKVHETGDLLP